MQMIRFCCPAYQAVLRLFRGASAAWHKPACRALLLSVCAFVGLTVLDVSLRWGHLSEPVEAAKFAFRTLRRAGPIFTALRALRTKRPAK